MEFQDRTLKCIDCGADFVFTAGEQLFFHDKQFKNEPKRCKACKGKRAAQVGAGGNGGHKKVERKTAWSAGRKKRPGPFKPAQGRPEVCRERFQPKRPSAGVVQKVSCQPNFTPTR